MKMLKYFSFPCALVLMSVFFAFAPAARAATTFPVDTAGIGAYVKLDSFTPQNFENAKKNLFDSTVSVGETYVIGLKQYATGDNDENKLNYHIYIGTNGWLAVYLLKDEVPSRIVNWRTASPLSDTMLKLAVDDAVAKMGATIIEPLKYYDFSHHEASKMTLIREIMKDQDPATSVNFNIYVPGTLYQASWALNCESRVVNGWSTSVYSIIDGHNGGNINAIPFVYGNYELGIFNANKDHKITLSRKSNDFRAGAVTLVIYKI